MYSLGLGALFKNGERNWKSLMLKPHLRPGMRCYIMQMQKAIYDAVIEMLQTLKTWQPKSYKI